MTINENALPNKSIVELTYRNVVTFCAAFEVERKAMARSRR